MLSFFLLKDMDQYPVSTCQRAAIVTIAWRPAIRTSLIVLLTCYLLIIVVLPNHCIPFNIFFVRPSAVSKIMYFVD